MDCVFCSILKGEIPALKVLETQNVLAFMDVNPLSRGHVLVVPKQHASKMHMLDDHVLADLMPQAKKVAIALNCSNYNILQNNGKEAHQEVMHVHFHIIPKIDKKGLGLIWDVDKSQSSEDIKTVHKEIIARLD